jgi:hypothetical protein
MPDFPDNTQDPSSEEQAAQERALSLGLVTAGLGILAQPRFRGEPASVPIARGALGGLETYEGSEAAAAQGRLEQQKLGVEQQKASSDAEYKNLEAQNSQLRTGIEAQNSQSLSALRATNEQANAPVGDGGLQMLQPYINDPATSSLAKAVSPDDVKKMPYSRFMTWIGDMNRTYTQAHNPDVQQSVITDYSDPEHPVQHVLQAPKTGGTPTEVYSAAGLSKQPKLSDLQMRLAAVKQAHPEWTPQQQMDFVDSRKEDVTVDTAYKKMQDADLISQQKETRQAAARQQLVAFTQGLKSQEDVNKALTKPITGMAPSLGVNPSTGKPAMKYTPLGLASVFEGPVYVDLPPGAAGGVVPEALAPPGKMLQLPPDQLSALKQKIQPGQVARVNGGRLVKRVGDNFIDVTNPPPGSPPPRPLAGVGPRPAPNNASVASPKPATPPVREPAAAPTLAAQPLKAPAPAAPSAASARPAPKLYRDASGKPLYNARTGQYLYVDGNGNYVDERGFPIQKVSGP